MERLFELIEPTKPIIDFYNKLWKGEEVKSTKVKLFDNLDEVDIFELISKEEFEKYHINEETIKKAKESNKTGIFLKSINNAYSTRINADSGIFEDKFITFEELDAMADENKIDEFIVEKCRQKTGRNEYSFATKVFSFMKPDTYPILDSISVTLLNQYYAEYCNSTEKNRKKNWGDYKQYVNDYRMILKKLELEVSFKEFDVFIWTYGTALSRYWAKIGVLKFESVQYRSNK